LGVVEPALQVQVGVDLGLEPGLLRGEGARLLVVVPEPLLRGEVGQLLDAALLGSEVKETPAGN
jgi:hypothetical protein